MKFEPTLNTGQLLQMCLVLVTVGMVYGIISTKIEHQNEKIVAIERSIEQQVRAFQQANQDTRSDLKEVTRAVNELTTGVALLRGRAAETGISGATKQ